jgi:hypothetical protein
MLGNDNLHLTRLSVEDMHQISLTWRARAQQKADPATCAIAAAMESVVRQRRAAALVRERITAARLGWAPLQRAASWAVSHF